MLAARNETWNGDGAGMAIEVEDDSDKYVTSTEGTHAYSTKHFVWSYLKRSCPLVTTLEIRYCTTLGLIKAGILPKPLSWDTYGRRYPRNPLQDTIPPVTPTKVRFESNNLDVLGTECELFDLTELE